MAIAGHAVSSRQRCVLSITYAGSRLRCVRRDAVIRAQWSVLLQPMAWPSVIAYAGSRLRCVRRGAVIRVQWSVFFATDGTAERHEVEAARITARDIDRLFRDGIAGPQPYYQRS